MTIYEMVKDDPAFKAFCRRRSTAKCPTMAEILERNRKARAADFRAFCKPRGILSILKEHEYVTACGDVLVRAVIRKKGNDFISEIIYDSREHETPEEIPDEAA